MSEWRAVGVVAEGQPIQIAGFNIWAKPWGDAKRTIELPHPSYPEQHHRMVVYEIDAGAEKIAFAAGELSPGVWGFYVLDPASG